LLRKPVIFFNNNKHFLYMECSSKCFTSRKTNISNTISHNIKLKILKTNYKRFTR